MDPAGRRPPVDRRQFCRAKRAHRREPQPVEKYQISGAPRWRPGRAGRRQPQAWRHRWMTPRMPARSSSPAPLRLLILAFAACPRPTPILTAPLRRRAIRFAHLLTTVRRRRAKPRREPGQESAPIDLRKVNYFVHKTLGNFSRTSPGSRLGPKNPCQRDDRRLFKARYEFGPNPPGRTQRRAEHSQDGLTVVVLARPGQVGPVDWRCVCLLCARSGDRGRANELRSKAPVRSVS